MHRSTADKDRARRGQRLGSLPRGEGVPDDAHHVPQETPEQWLLSQEHAEHADTAKQPPQQQGATSHKPKLTVPYLGLEVTPELVAISMGECSSCANMSVYAAVCNNPLSDWTAAAHSCAEQPTADQGVTSQAGNGKCQDAHGVLTAPSRPRVCMHHLVWRDCKLLLCLLCPGVCCCVCSVFCAGDPRAVPLSPVILLQG